MYVQLHLMLNHFPIIGVFFSVVIFLYIILLRRESDEFRRFGIVFFFVVCLTALPVYITGNLAEEVVEELSGHSEEFLEAHESLGGFASILSMVFGIVSLLVLIWYRKPRLIPVRALILLFVGSFILSIFMAITGSFGGKIMHAEIRDAESFNPFKGRIYSRGSSLEKVFGKGSDDDGDDDRDDYRKGDDRDDYRKGDDRQRRKTYYKEKNNTKPPKLITLPTQ